jgi:NADH dehydrogenase
LAVVTARFNWPTATTPPRSFYVGGKMAATIKEFVCTMVVKQIAKESRKPGSYSWPDAKKLPATT